MTPKHFKCLSPEFFDISIEGQGDYLSTHFRIVMDGGEEWIQFYNIWRTGVEKKEVLDLFRPMITNNWPRDMVDFSKIKISETLVFHY